MPFYKHPIKLGPIFTDTIRIVAPPGFLARAIEVHGLEQEFSVSFNDHECPAKSFEGEYSFEQVGRRYGDTAMNATREATLPPLKQYPHLSLSDWMRMVDLGRIDRVQLHFPKTLLDEQINITLVPFFPGVPPHLIHHHPFCVFDLPCSGRLRMISMDDGTPEFGIRVDGVELFETPSPFVEKDLRGPDRQYLVDRYGEEHGKPLNLSRVGSLQIVFVTPLRKDHGGFIVYETDDPAEGHHGDTVLRPGSD